MASASSSSSSSSSREKYDVFLSFRGEDTRDGFTGYLYHALDLKHIVTFKDDENLESGHRISEIMEAIKESKICIIVFSKDFASSTWCLDEVVRILECKRNGSAVVPIFYGIEPSVVRKQQKGYAEAFAKHEQDGREMVQQWRDALKEVAGISGYESNKIRPEYRFIEKIVEDVLLKLSKYVSANDHFKRHLIGIEKPTKEIEGLLCIGSMNVRIIGLYGMGGIGKTTLARAIFQTFYCHFESYCFLNGVREEFERHGINHLREKLLFELFKDKTSLNMESTAIQDRCRRTKVLIVLDDLDAILQLNRLLPKGCTFGDGSRIIVTTRDAQVLKSRADELYEVKRLNDSDALTLFRLHAFGQNSDLPGYEALSKSAADYAHGNPLALEVLGLSLYSKSIKEWESALDKLKTDPDRTIQKVLKISYDGLDDEAIQGIFLDIACFFDGEVDREYVESMLHRNEQHSDGTAGISVLIDKSLIIECQNKLSMHALLRQMGKAIVCDKNKEPGKRSRLWNAKDVSYVLERSTGSSEVEGILLNLSELRKDVKVKPTAFSKMYHLRFLRMHCDDRFCNGEIFYEKVGWGPYNREVRQQIYLPYEGLEFPSDELRYLQWDLYPLKDFLSNFSPENLVELVMRDSQLVELHWDENQPVEKLKKMDLSYSEHLIQIPNLCGARNLESINLQGCISLVQIPLCFKNLDKLELLVLSDCENLKDGMENLPLNIRELKLCRTAIEVLPLRVRSLSGLLDLDMSGCTKLKDGIENLPSNLKELRLCGTAIQVVPSTIGCLMGLSHLDLYNCERLESLPESIWKLESLEWLDLSNCPNLIELEDCASSSLRYLKISGCTGLRSIIALPPSLNCLDANNCTSLVKISSWWTPTVQDYDPQVQHQNNKSEGEIYNFEQCLKLDEDTRIIIADSACRRILSAHDDISYLEMVYPGNVIPRWFHHQAYGESFIQLPPNWLNTDDSRFKFVFVAVFAFKISGPETKIRLRFNFTTSMDSSVNYEDVCTLQVNNSSDHVLIKYATIDLRHVFGVNWSSVCRMVTGASFHVFMEEEKKGNWMIKSWGLQVINFTASRDLRLWDLSASLSSSSTRQKKYDVFLSFGGDDTLNNFIGHVYHALCRKHIRIFKHDENRESGHEISEIMDAINESKICMIVFSKDFASSTWCLDDVVRILDCRRDWEDIILPIFYGIEPSIVRKQDGSYAEAFNKHEQRFKDNMDKVQRWRDALKEVTNLSGYDSKDFGDEYKVIGQIVGDVLMKLFTRFLTYYSPLGLVGIEFRKKTIEQFLDVIGSLGVYTIGLYGTRGIGKTSLAMTVFQKLYHQFERRCYLCNVRGEFNLRERLIFELLDEKHNPSMEWPSIQERFQGTKVLIVGDDLDYVGCEFGHVMSMFKFGNGSRIIVTSSDVKVLNILTDQVYEVCEFK
ncbi:TMV resistance protein N-like isoform X1 [Ziziphus jujuba]|uniref:ADP-ribosyl cyclase/cyclic ADP-ribose hydrolase n=1 Tax=Ziziphus jujuba TaxID=326968 RepID=A0ABM4A4A6_ZIZJJ|nr:TMV resistance protein N-like isoform X1 [Ziziphus jujuba]XP_060671562.1 TMV resistance protein N-like isoform X1 [Ziziphus jujuba]